MNLKEVVLTHETGAGPRPVDLTITGFEFRPAATSAVAPRGDETSGHLQGSVCSPMIADWVTMWRDRGGEP
jgi:hypothetical protein